jgi:hypothetical protein
MNAVYKTFKQKQGTKANVADGRQFTFTSKNKRLSGQADSPYDCGR